MLLRPIPLPQPTRPLQLWPRALRVTIPWSLGLLDLYTLGLGLRRQRARLPSKRFHPVCVGLKMDRILEVDPVQVVCRTLLRPTSLQQPTRLLQLWTRGLREAVSWMPGLLVFDTLGLGLRCQRASLPSKILFRGLDVLKMGSPLKIVCQGWMQVVCWITLIPHPLQHQGLAEAFDLLFLQPSRPPQPCLRPLHVSTPWVPGLFRLLSLSLVLLCLRARIPPMIFFPRPTQ